MFGFTNGEKWKAANKGISALAVSGYKSIRREQRIEIGNLTVLAGANSSGKSSIMQPLLLLKQTLEEPYDRGALLLDGENVRFTAADQLLSRGPKGSVTRSFAIEIEKPGGIKLRIVFKRDPGKGLDISEASYTFHNEDLHLTQEQKSNDVERILRPFLSESKSLVKTREEAPVVARQRCFLGIGTAIGIDEQGEYILGDILLPLPASAIGRDARRVIHVPGLRGNPERTYKKTVVGEHFPGLFQEHVASVISEWQSRQSDKLKELCYWLSSLGLTWKVESRAVAADETRVELRVGRLPKAGTNGVNDLVSIADVGFGVSQVLPVVVALLTAEENQMVYIEQPEVHLHPMAILVMAQLLCSAAKRGVRVVVETHSDLLLLGIQTAVAEGDIGPELVKLHWFQRDAKGNTQITSADLDENGAFGEWPEDFGHIALSAQSAYLDASEVLMSKQADA